VVLEASETRDAGPTALSLAAPADLEMAETFRVTGDERRMICDRVTHRIARRTSRDFRRIGSH
jgi:hypothetical protein